MKLTVYTKAIRHSFIRIIIKLWSKNKTYSRLMEQREKKI